MLISNHGRLLTIMNENFVYQTNRIGGKMQNYKHYFKALNELGENLQLRLVKPVDIKIVCKAADDCLLYYFRLPFANNAFSLKNNRRWKLPHTINNRCAAVLYCKSGNFKFIWDGSRPKTKGLTSYLHSEGRIITPPILAVHQKYVKTQLSHEPQPAESML